MPINIKKISIKVIIIGFLLFINSIPIFAQLYGVPVSNIGNKSVSSPNKEWLVSVKINKEKLTTLTIQRAHTGSSKELMGVSRSGWVLWSPNSQAFAFTDAAFANHYFVHLCSVQSVGAECRDISSEIETYIKTSLSSMIEIDKFYTKALKWRSSITIIVGVCIVTSPIMKPGQTWVPASISYRAFLVDLRTGNISKELSEQEARNELSVSLDRLEW